jgi:hypothetical protein
VDNFVATSAERDRKIMYPFVSRDSIPCVRDEDARRRPNSGRRVSGAVYLFINVRNLSHPNAEL